MGDSERRRGSGAERRMTRMMQCVPRRRGAGGGSGGNSPQQTRRAQCDRHPSEDEKMREYPTSDIPMSPCIGHAPNRMRGAQQHLSSYRTPLRRRRRHCRCRRGRGTFGFGGTQRRGWGCRAGRRRGSVHHGSHPRGYAWAALLAVIFAGERWVISPLAQATRGGIDGAHERISNRRRRALRLESCAAGGRGELGRRAMRIRAVWTIKENRTIPSIRTTRGYCATAEYLQDPILWKATADP